jgi:ubiquinone/menaquinone biosynthesis C-methylase UbiE
MEARLQLRVQRYGWDRAAAYYENLWRDVLLPATRGLLDRAALQPGESVLDVACGSGVLTVEALRAVGPTGRVVATDLSDGMLTAAQNAVAAAGLSAACFVQADGGALASALGEERFDVVLCGLGLMYMPDPEAALKGMKALLRPGGRLVASVWGERRDCGWAGVFPIIDARVRSDVCPMFFRLGAGDALARALREAGFDPVQATRIACTLDYATADLACDAALLGGPVALAYSHLDDAGRREVRAEYLESISPWRDARGFRIPGSFVVAEGRTPAS